MDVGRWNEDDYQYILRMTSSFLKRTGFNTRCIPFVPISVFQGDNVLEHTINLPWFRNGWAIEARGGATTLSGRSLLEAIDAMQPPARLATKPLRLPIHNIYDIAGIGTVPVGCVKSGDVTAEVISIQRHHEEVDNAGPGDIIGFNIGDAGPTRRGDAASDPDNDPAQGCGSFTARIMVTNCPYSIYDGYTFIVDCHTAHVKCTIELLQKLDRRTGRMVEENPEYIQSGDSTKVKMTPSKPMCVERYSDYPDLGRFAVRAKNSIIGAGVALTIDY